ncbi:DNA-binding protein [uncultured Exiguobacterium sp.]|uniref:DNA-binding protein n=1 Tax=uncultured Exiguobacterium sp. TaxID=202669 RepID=UPI003747A82B
MEPQNLHFGITELKMLDTIIKAINKHSEEFSSRKEWLSINEAANYAGVSYNTFIKFRSYGLKVSEIDGVKRVSKKTIDSFLEKYCI